MSRDSTVNTPEGDPDPVRQGTLSLRATSPEDCAFVVSVEQHPDNAPHIGQWTEAQHESALRAAGIAHWIIEHRNQPIGFVILEGTDNPDDSLLLRRIAIASKGRGHGRTAVMLAARYCFDVLGFHRLWLNVSPRNRRARNLYRKLGFVEEGIARESVKEGDTYTSMHVFSMLEQEYRALR